ncbi:DUF1642 domain-containing protein [Streptococcus macedonicus]|nr:DUF1642 domain-containing protein [Streptococcus macedonicus]
MNKQEAIEKIKNIETLNINDIIAGQSVDMVIKNQVLDIINQIDEPQKPKVPQVAVEFYERYKDDNLVLGEWFGDFYSNEAIEEFPRMDELTKWLYDNDNETNRQREFALVTLVTLGIDAVEVEKEKLYTVELPNPNAGGYVVLCKTGDGRVSIAFANTGRWQGVKNVQLTEAEIKQDFDWAWQFAKEVDE